MTKFNGHVVFGFEDSKGRVLGIVWCVKMTDASDFRVGVQVSRDGNSFGACQPWATVGTLDEAFALIAHRATSAFRRYSLAR